MKKKVLGIVGTLEIELTGTEEIAVLILSGQIDHYTASEITKITDQHLVKGHAKVIIDLTNITYLDSSGLSALININVKLSKTDGTLRLVGLQGKAKEVFELAGLLNMFQLFHSREGAFENL